LSPTFSIIIPTYNRASHLPTAIESVVAQSRADWELIIVDDGSKDNTKGAVLPYTNDPRIRYHYQKNKELNGARNTGARLAQGTYCCFLDDDDNYEANHLEVLTQAIAVTGGKHGIYRTNMRIIGDGINLVSLPFENGKNALVQLWQTPRNLLPLAIRRDLLLRQPFDENDLLIDDFIWLNTALTATTLFQTDTVSANYVQHTTNRTKLYHSVQMIPQIVARLREAYEVPGVKAKVDKAILQLRIQHQYMHLARQLGRRGDRLEALKVWYKGVSQGGIKPVRNVLKTLAVVIVR
jgi:glycosyltransferase involved in cell wall biosynthesis